MSKLVSSILSFEFLMKQLLLPSKVPKSAQRKRFAPMKLRVFVPVWGAKHLDYLIELAVPSLLADGNLPKVREQFDVSFDFYTTRADLQRLSISRSILDLKRLYQVQINTFAASAAMAEYLDFTRTMIASMRQSAAERSLFMMFQADTIIGSSSLPYFAEVLAETRAFLAWCGRLQAEDCFSALKSNLTDQSLVVSNSELVRLSLNFPHDEFRNYEVSDSYGPSNPLHLIWTSGDRRSAVVHSHVISPIGINFSRIDKSDADRYFDSLRQTTPDDSRTHEILLGDMSEVHLVTDSSKFFINSLTDRSRFPAGLPSTLKSVQEETLKESIVRYQRSSSVTEYARFLACQPIVLQGGGDLSWAIQKSIETRKLLTAISIVLYTSEERKNRTFKRVALRELSHLVGCVLRLRIISLVGAALRVRSPQTFIKLQRIIESLLTFR